MLLRRFRSATIALTPESIAIRSAGKTTRLCDIDVSKFEKPEWNQVITELENSTINYKLRKVRFIVSNHFVRYEVLPWQEGVISKWDWQALAENHLQNVFGESAPADWKVSVAMQGYGKPLVVSAIDRGFLMRLESLASRKGWVIESIEPALTSISNYYHKKIKQNDWLMVAENQRVVLARKIKGSIVSCTIICPIIGLESEEGKNLIKRSLRLKTDMLPKTIHLFGKLQLSADTFENTNLSVLAKNQGHILSEMLVESS